MLDKMNYTDKEKNFIRGYFQIRVLDSFGNVIQDFEKENIVVNVARTTMAKHLSGQSTTPINKIIFGTKQNPPQPDASRTQLYSQESIPQDFMYTISFTPPLTNGPATNIVEDDQGSGSTVEVTRTNNSVLYSIVMKEPAGNHGGSVAYTECGMFVGNDLFAMRVYPVRNKDANSVIEVNWTFYF